MFQLVRAALAALCLSFLIPAMPAVAAECDLAAMSAKLKDLSGQSKALKVELAELAAAVKALEEAAASSDSGTLARLADALGDLGPIPALVGIPLDALDSLFGDSEPDPRIQRLLVELVKQLQAVRSELAAVNREMAETLQELQHCEEKARGNASVEFTRLLDGLASPSIEALVFVYFSTSVRDEAVIDDLVEALSESDSAFARKLNRNVAAAFRDRIGAAYASLAPPGSDIADLVGEVYDELLTGKSRSQLRRGLEAILEDATESDREAALRVLIDWYARMREAAKAGSGLGLPDLPSGLRELGGIISLLHQLLEAGEAEDDSAPSSGTLASPTTDAGAAVAPPHDP